MAEGYEPYHVPQQSRRDKLRVVHPTGSLEAANNLQGLLPLYDPSFFHSDSLNCASHHHPNCGVKEEGANLMGYVGGLMNASSSSSQHPYNLDPQSSLALNPNQIQDINNSASFLFTPQNLRDFGEVVVYKPEPLSVTHHQDQSNQGLSLSLSSHYTHQHQQNLPLEINFQRYGSPILNDKITTASTGGYVVPAGINFCSSGGGNGGSTTSYDVSGSSAPLGPFTGYASVLKVSRFLKPTQQLLEDYCCVGRGIDAPTSMDPPLETLGRNEILDEYEGLSRGDGKKSRLISMLNEVYRKYKQYYQQMQAVVASFESVSGLGNAAPYANLALNAMTKHFRCLKNAITDQLQFTNKTCGHMTHGKVEVPKLGNTDGGYYSQRSVQSPGFIDQQPVWRPQRGLPERAVTVLRAWLFEHFLHPYPTDTDKLMLAKQTGLSRNQVSNWFINARVRLWKPMVEEIHSLETRQGQKTSDWEERNVNRSCDNIPSANTVASEHPSTSTQRNQDTPSKRTRNEFNVPSRTDESTNLSYSHFSTHPHLGDGSSTPLGSSTVSLTLGLHQNNGIVFSEPFPINAAQRFGLGLEASNDGYVMGGYEAQTRHFGRDMIGGQLLHDFVG